MRTPPHRAGKGNGWTSSTRSTSCTRWRFDGRRSTDVHTAKEGLRRVRRPHRAFLPSIVAAAAILRRPVDKLAHGSELIPQFAEPRDHTRQGREKPLGRVADSLGIVQIHDRAWMGTFHDVLDLPRGRHGAQALTLD